MKHNSPNIAVIGIGQMALRIHLPILKKLADEGLCNLVALCDLDGAVAAKAAKDFSFESFFSSADEMLETEKIDALYIFSSAEVHHKYGLLALKKGIHLFVEKPPAPSFAAFEEMMIAIPRSGKVLAVAGFNRRFQPALQYVKSLASAGLEITFIESTFHKPLIQGEVPFGVKSWLMANGIHAIDVLTYIMDSLPSELYAVSNKIDAKKSADENFSATMKWPNGSVASLLSDNTAGGRKERYVFHASGRTFEIEEDSLTEIVDGKASVIPLEHSRGFEEEHRSFLESIKSMKEPINSFSHVGDSVRLAELIEQGFTGSIHSAAESIGKKETASHLSPIKISPVLKGGILILASAHYKAYLSGLSDKFFIVSKDELFSCSQKKREEIAAVLTGQGEPISEDIFHACPNIKVVGIAGLSLKKYNPDAAFKRGIPIVNASYTYSHTVAEFVIMQAIAGLRKAVVSHEVMRTGGWGTSQSSRKAEFVLFLRSFILKHPALHGVRNFLLPQWKNLKNKPEFNISRPKNRSLNGVSFGIIGFGGISRAVIFLLKAHGTENIKIFSEFEDASFSRAHGVKFSSFDQVMGCDVVVLARGLSDRTKNSIGHKELSFLKQGAVFINAARAEIIQRDALIKRLERGDIYACLDVFEPEPPKTNDPLRKLKNVFLTSHLAGNTAEMYADAPKEVIKKVADYLSGIQVDTINADRNSNMS